MSVLFSTVTGRSVVTVDIDSTLADTRHRAALIKADDREATDWLAYARACADDEPTDVIALVKLLVHMYAIVLVTSRPEGAYDETMEWLTRHQVPFDGLIMNDGRHGDATAFKVYAITRLAETHTIVLHIDDWWETAEAIKKALLIPIVVVRVYDPRVLELTH